MYEDLAEDLEKELGDDYTLSELLKHTAKMGLLSPKGMDEYNLRNDFLERKDAQKDLPKKEQKSNRGITDDMAAENNCSFSRMFSIVRDSYNA